MNTVDGLCKDNEHKAEWKQSKLRCTAFALFVLEMQDQLDFLSGTIGYGDKRRSFAQVVTLFNQIHPEREPISKSTASKTLRRFK